MTEERRSVSEVRDIPAEVWIKVLSGLAAITLVLTSFIGVRAIDKLDQIGDTLADVVGFVQIHSLEISSLKKGLEETNVKVEGNTRNINEIKGAK